MLVEIKDSNGKVVGIIVANPKVFSTGSRGFYGNGKVEIDGKRYQCNMQMVEIGSKPSS
jgi:hypothetical protein